MTHAKATLRNSNPARTRHAHIVLNRNSATTSSLKPGLELRVAQNADRDVTSGAGRCGVSSGTNFWPEVRAGGRVVGAAKRWWWWWCTHRPFLSPTSLFPRPPPRFLCRGVADVAICSASKDSPIVSVGSYYSSGVLYSLLCINVNPREWIKVNIYRAVDS